MDSYQQGWNDRIRNLPFNDKADLEWKIGWMDCNYTISCGAMVELF